jgi:hypothetical protein
MTSKRPQAASAPTKRPTRSRPTPQWLLTSTELDQMAQRRCLQLLSVLSGEKSVSEAIAEMKVSRGTYYQLETRALAAMLAALAPVVDSATSKEVTPAGQIKALEEKVKKLEQGKRRLERLLLLTRRVVKPGPMKLGHGRQAGSRSSRPSARKTASPSSTPTPPSGSSGPSTPTRDGEGGPTSGSAS